MTRPLRLALAQINTVVGDIKNNTSLIRGQLARAITAHADVVALPELSISGYPAEDLLNRAPFIKKCGEAIDKIAEDTKDITAIVGSPAKINGVSNAAIIMEGGKVSGSVLKTELPNYGVFDERRYFTPGTNGPLLKVGDCTIGISICEDIWVENSILASQADEGANLFINIAASPYREDGLNIRHKIASAIVARFKIPFAYVNLVGGQDELVFDGRSFVMGTNGKIIAEATAFTDDLLIVDIPVSKSEGIAKREVIEVKPPLKKKPPIPVTERRKIEDQDEEIYEAITLALSDYVGKNGFGDVVIASSGGIDSALTCAIAVDALGACRVHTVSLPSPYSSEGSITDAKKLAENLGVEMISLPIGRLMKEYGTTLAQAFAGREPGVAEENIQARIRGALVMALSNKFNWLVLTTGNKSETAVGYCTLYGDMAGGFAIIKDLLKTKVYDLCRWRNKKAGYDIIPLHIIDKPPSAELKPDQKDIDTLPPYDVLDPILKEYIENEKSVDEIEKLGYSRELILRIVHMLDASEYKRRQGPIGVKITQKSFGRDRRHPITTRYIEE